MISRRGFGPVMGLSGLLFIAAVACGGGDTAKLAEEKTEVASQAVQGAFSKQTDFSEARGLPPRPSAATVTVKEVFELLAATHIDVAMHLAARHGLDKKVRIIEGYSRKGPIFLKDNAVLVPNSDGVIDSSAPITDPNAIDLGQACQPGSTHTCEIIHPKDPLVARPYEAIIVVGWDVEMAGDLSTDGKSMIVVAEHFRAHGKTIDASAGCYERPAGSGNLVCYDTHEPPDTENKAAPGRNGRRGGAVAIYAAEVDGIRVRSKGLKGENGKSGRPADGQVTESGVIDNHTPSPRVYCNGHISKQAQHGGDGGQAGRGGDILVPTARCVGSGHRGRNSRRVRRRNASAPVRATKSGARRIRPSAPATCCARQTMPNATMARTTTTTGGSTARISTARRILM